MMRAMNEWGGKKVFFFEKRTKSFCLFGRRPGKRAGSKPVGGKR
jgi:hypothetical protein